MSPELELRPIGENERIHPIPLSCLPVLYLKSLVLVLQMHRLDLCLYLHIASSLCAYLSKFLLFIRRNCCYRSSPYSSMLFLIDFIPNDLISKYSHILRLQGLGLQHMIFGRSKLIHFAHWPPNPQPSHIQNAFIHANISKSFNAFHHQL